MGSSSSVPRVSYEDIITGINDSTMVLVSTLSPHEQDCLIHKTVPIHEEEALLNRLLQTGQTKMKPIILYGRNCNDTTIITKYKQCVQLGFQYVYVYVGGLFEWLLLQDIYGNELFPTTSEITDILKYRAPKQLHM
jgi:hypothetical protein